jgi:hypothetical protein
MYNSVWFLQSSIAAAKGKEMAYSSVEQESRLHSFAGGSTGVLNSGHCTCLASALLLEPHLQPFLL